MGPTKLALESHLEALKEPEAPRGEQEILKDSYRADVPDPSVLDSAPE